MSARVSPLAAVFVAGLQLLAACDQSAQLGASGEAHSDEPGHGEAALEPHLPHEVAVSPRLAEQGRIKLATARRSDTASARRVPGEVVSATDGAAEVGVMVAGRVATLEVNVGDRVKKDDVLAWVESSDVGVARAELSKAQAELEIQKAHLARQETLQQESATAPAQVERARAALRAAQAERSAVLLRLSAWGAGRGSGARYPVLAPIEGVVTARHAILGASLRADMPLFSIVAPERVLVMARFSEGPDGVPEVGASLQLTLRGAPRTEPCIAKVEANSGVVDARTRTIIVRLRPEPSCQGLRPGTYVEVHSPPRDQAEQSPHQEEQPQAKEQGVLVPTRAVVFLRGKEVVFVPTQTAGVFAVRVVVVSSRDDQDAALSQGVQAGEQVVEEGTLLLKGEAMGETLGGDGHGH